MPFTRDDLLKDLMLIQERLNSLFDQTLSSFSHGLHEMAGCWTPAVDIYETPEKLVITAELPGTAREDVDIQVEGTQLTLRGERKPNKDVDEESYHRMECSYGKFARRLELPFEIQAEKVQAHMNDGVLKIVLPKRAEGYSRRVEIR